MRDSEELLERRFRTKIRWDHIVEQPKKQKKQMEELTEACHFAAIERKADYRLTDATR